MANNSINDLAFLNQIIVETDDIRMLLSKATALMHIASDDNFLKHPHHIVDLYLSFLSKFKKTFTKPNESIYVICSSSNLI